MKHEQISVTDSTSIYIKKKYSISSVETVHFRDAN